jgi:hypothetical protein
MRNFLLFISIWLSFLSLKVWFWINESSVPL